VAGRASDIKIVGMMEMGVPISPDPAGLSVHLPLLSSFCTIKPSRWYAKIQLLDTSECPHMPVQKEVGKRSQKAAQLCAGCLQLLEIYWNLKTLLEISLNLMVLLGIFV